MESHRNAPRGRDRSTRSSRRSLQTVGQRTPGALWPFVTPALIALAAGSAAAHTQSGALGSGASATDYYQILCSDDGAGPPQSLTVQIQDAAPVAAPLVSVQVRAGTALANATDSVDGDGAASVAIHVDGGEQAVYDVLVDKTAAGSENYVLTYHCWTGPGGTGLHTGTDLITRQNQ